MGQHSLDKLRGADQRAFQVDVGVQKTGQNDLAAAVRLFRAAVFAHTDDQPLRHRNVSMADLVGEHVDVGRVFQNQVRWLTSRCGVDDAPLFQKLTVDLAGITLCHGTYLLL